MTTNNEDTLSMIMRFLRFSHGMVTSWGSSFSGVPDSVLNPSQGTYIVLVQLQDGSKFPGMCYCALVTDAAYSLLVVDSGAATCPRGLDVLRKFEDQNEAHEPLLVPHPSFSLYCTDSFVRSWILSPTVAVSMKCCGRSQRGRS
jgi:hypothetical protein